MYVHIGDDVLVRSSDIIAIFDKETIMASPFAEGNLPNLNKKVIHLEKGHCKSIVIVNDFIYFSPLASGTIKKRAEKLSVQEIQWQI